MDSEYGIDNHRHRFSVWAAARATQRGFTDVATLRRALEASGVVAILNSTDLNDWDISRFDESHRHWCLSVTDFLNAADVRRVTFGRAAKLVAVYLKSAIVLGPHTDSAFARIAHPPIDSMLLRNLATCKDVLSMHKRRWATIRWTTLNAEKYDELIRQLREVLGPDEPFWKLERYWTVTSGARLE